MQHSLDKTISSFKNGIDELTSWSREFGHLESSLETENYGKTPFNGQIFNGHLGDLKYCCLSASPHLVKSATPNRQEFSRNFYKIIFQKSGHSEFHQGSNHILLEPGQWLIYDNAYNFSIVNKSPVEQIVILLPREKIFMQPTEISTLFAKAYTSDLGMSKILFDYIISTFDECKSMGKNRCDELGDVMLHLIRLSLNEFKKMQSKITIRETQKGRIKDFISHNLKDPNLSIGMIARKYGYTKRYLHKIFSDEDMTLSRYIWMQRLRKCYAELSDPERAKQTITEISYKWGFNSSSHFNKLFKDNYGIAPSEIRGMPLCLDVKTQ